MLMNFDIKDQIIEEEKERHLVQVIEATQPKNKHTNLKMIMLNSSLNHAYAQMEYEMSTSIMRREELSVRMEALREAYFHAREKLGAEAPATVWEIEEDLETQKKEFFKPRYNA